MVMKGKYTIYLTNLVMLALGVVLIAFYNDDRMAEFVTIALGVLFLAPSLFSTIMLLFVNVPQNDVRYNPRYNLIPVISGLSFGLVIVVKAAVFVGLLKYLFAMLLIVGGLYYVFYLAFARSRVVVPAWYYVLPSIVACAGFATLLMPIDNNALIFLTTGVSLIAMVVTSVITALAERTAAKMRAQAEASAAETTDVTAAVQVDAEEQSLKK